MMLKWIQKKCATYGKHIDNFKSLFTNGKPLVYLVDFYLHEYMTSPQYFKEAQVTDHDHALMESF